MNHSRQYSFDVLFLLSHTSDALDHRIVIIVIRSGHNWTAAGCCLWLLVSTTSSSPVSRRRNLRARASVAGSVRERARVVLLLLSLPLELKFFNYNALACVSVCVDLIACSPQCVRVCDNATHNINGTLAGWCVCVCMCPINNYTLFIQYVRVGCVCVCVCATHTRR